MTNTTRDFPLELKSIVADGEFQGLVAIYGVRDDAGDRIEPGAFTKTLQERRGKVPILWNHVIHEPIGIGTLSDLSEGLWILGRLNLEVARARETHALMKQAQAEGSPVGLSIGFDTLQAEWHGADRHVKEIRLWEVSPTMFPAQSLAIVSSVKAHGGTINDVFNTMREMRAYAIARTRRSRA